MILLAAALLLAHSWYPSDCCGGDDAHGDCRPIPCAEIIHRNEFMYWRGFIFDEFYSRRSQDSQCHICTHHFDGTDKTIPMCIFTPEATS
jgi:hypothetical protein